MFLSAHTVADAVKNWSNPLGRYRANDIEVIYLYDLDNRLLFTVVNREFIVGVDSKYLSGSVEYSYPVVDPYSGISTEANGEKKISLDHPFVPLEYKRSLWQTYPYSPIVDVLDLFDDVVAIESLIYHTISIMTPSFSMSLGLPVKVIGVMILMV